MWKRVESLRGYVWKRVVDISGPGLWTGVDQLCGREDGGVWASAVDEVGSMSWRRVGSRRGLAWSRVVGRDGLVSWT